MPTLYEETTIPRNQETTPHTERSGQAHHAAAADAIHAQDPTALPPVPAGDGTHLSAAALSTLAAALLAACGGGDVTDSDGAGGGSASANSAAGSDPGAGAGLDPSTDVPNATVSPNAPAQDPGTSSAVAKAEGFNHFNRPSNDGEASRFLQQCQLNATTEEIALLRGPSGGRGITYAEYLQQQYAKPIGQTGRQWLEARGYGENNRYRYYFQTYPADYMLWKQLFTEQDGMRKRMALALSEFFVVSLESTEYDWRSHGMAYYWDLLNANAFGNFRKLLEDVTLSPSMGFYLNTRGNEKEDEKTGRVPDENYAREVMQLFSIGLYQLNQNGTEKLDANGKKIDVYSQADVTNLARVFTGYDFDTSDNVRIPALRENGSPEGYTLPSRTFASKPMSFIASRHSNLAVRFLGTSIAANTPGPAALKTALDTLFKHPNVGPFFGRQMIQRLVTSNPSPAYVARVAAAFNNNGKGVRGDLKAVWTAVFLDDEARNPANIKSLSFGKLREPMLRFIQWGRSFGFRSALNSWKIPALTNPGNELGQSPMHSPSVFNFFRPGFVPPNTPLAATKSTAPEFQLVNETSVAGYLNYMQDVIRYGQYVNEPRVPQAQYEGPYVNDVQATYVKELALVTNTTALVRRLNLILCSDQLSAVTQADIVAALNATPITGSSSADDKLNRVASAVLMVMASPEYLVQK